MKTMRAIGVAMLAVVTAMTISAAMPRGAAADPCNGAEWGNHRVEAFASRSFDVCCSGGEWTQITVSGDGTSDLDLLVYDGFGRLIASDTDSSDECVATFFVTRGGDFRVVVRNLGGIYNDFRIGAY